MLSFYDRVSFKTALQLSLDPKLHRLLAERIGSLVTASYDLTEMTHIVVVELGDTEADILAAIGLSPLINPIDAARFPDVGFVPWWDWLQDHGDWFEMIITIGNSGFAYLLLITDAIGIDSDLLLLCRTHAR